MDVGGSKGGSKRRRPTDTGAHLQHTQPAFQAAGPSQKGPNVAKSGQMWPKEVKVVENGQIQKLPNMVILRRRFILEG